MLAKLPALHEGHSPIVLQNAFHDAVEAIEAHAGSLDEASVIMDGSAVPVAKVIEAMLVCTDLVPIRTRGVLEVLAGRLGPEPHGLDTFGSGARLALHYCAAVHRAPHGPVA